MVFNINSFSRLNDHHGHTAGDHILTTIANRLRSSTRPEDTCARLGNDEFAVLYDHINCFEAIEHIAGNLMDHIIRPIPWHGQDIHIKCRMGVSVVSGNNCSTAECIAQCHQAMAHSKMLGKTWHRYGMEIAAQNQTI